MENVILYLNKAAEVFWAFSEAMLIQSSILIVLLLVIDRLIRKRVRAVFRYCIWMLVFAKLLLPPSLCLPTGVGYWCNFNIWPVNQQVTPETPIKTSERQSDAIAADYGLGHLPPVGEPMRREVPAVTEDGTYMQPVEASELESPSVIVATPASPVVTLSWKAFVLLGWLVGVLVLSVLLIQRFLFVKSLIAQSESAEGHVLETLNQCRKQVGLNRPIELRLTANMLSPAACGLLNPVILMPASLLDKLTEDKLKTVLIHELAHIKRGDLWVNFLQTVLQIVYFYNPFLWIANAMVRGIREKAVDEMVLTKLGDQADSYSNTLIDIAEIAFSKPHFSLRLVGVVESKKALTDRIKHILSRPFPKSAKIGLVGLAAIIITAAVLLPMAKGEKSEGSSQEPEEVLRAITDRIKKHPKTSDRDRNFSSNPKIYWEEIGLGIELIINNKVSEDQAADFLQASELVGCTYGVEHDGVFRLFGQLDIPRKDIFANYKLRTLSLDGESVQHELLDVYPMAVGGSLSWSRETTNKLDPEQSLELQLDVAWYQMPDSMVENLPDKWRDKDEYLKDAVNDTKVKKLCEYMQKLELSKESKWEGIFDRNFPDSKTSNSERPTTNSQNYTATLPNGDMVKLVALFRPKDNPIVFWAPDGTVIDSPKLRKTDFANANNRELAYVLQRPERKYKDGYEPPAPGGNFYTVHGWNQYQLESGETLVIKRASGYGPWTDMGQIEEGQDLGGYNLTEVSQLGEQILAKMFWKFNPEFGIRLVAVDKKGKEYPMEASDEFLGNFEQGQQMLYFQSAMGLNKSELSHFKLQRRPLHWVRFEGFATEPKQISTNSDLQTNNYAATLPNGVTVELLGICEHPSEGKQWWAPDGSLFTLPEGLVIKESSRMVADEKEQKYELLFKYQFEDEMSSSYRIEGSTGVATMSTEIPSGGTGGYEAEMVYFKDPPDSTRVHVYVATGRWKTKFAGFSSKGDIVLPDLLISAPIEENGNLVITTKEHGYNFKYSNHQSRVILKSHNGDVITTNYTSLTHSDADERELKSEFKNIQLDEVQEITYQTRSYFPVTFKNVSLRPGGEREGEEKREQRFHGLDLTTMPSETDPAKLIDIFVEYPEGSNSYDVNENVKVVYSGLDGTVYYIPNKNVFYIQHNKLGSSILTYYGAFEGDPRRVLDLPPNLSLRPGGEREGGDSWDNPENLRVNRDSQKDPVRASFPDSAGDNIVHLYDSFDNDSRKYIDIYEKARKPLDAFFGQDGTLFTESLYNQSKQGFEKLAKDQNAYPLSLYAQRWIILLDWLAEKRDALITSQVLIHLAEDQKSQSESNLSKMYAAVVLARDGYMEQAIEVFTQCPPEQTPQWGWFVFEMNKYFEAYAIQAEPGVTRQEGTSLVQEAKTQEQWQQIETPLRQAQTAYADYLEYWLLPSSARYITIKSVGESTSDYQNIDRYQLVTTLRTLQMSHLDAFNLGATTDSISKRVQTGIRPKILAVWLKSLNLIKDTQYGDDYKGQEDEIKERCKKYNISFESLIRYWDEMVSTGVKNASLRPGGETEGEVNTTKTEEIGWKELTLPDVEEQAVVLDLVTGKYIEIPYEGRFDLDDDAITEFLKSLKQGDFLYNNHGFFCLRGATMDGKPFYESGYPFPWYKIPKYLPFASILQTVDGRKYNLNVIEADGKGCRLLYSLISTGERKTEAKSFLFPGVATEEEVYIAKSANNLWVLRKALSYYAGDHDDNYPDTVEELKSYFEDEDVFNWVIRNITYLGQGKSPSNSADTVIAYDKSMLLKVKNGTNVLFADSHLVFVEAETLEELGISLRPGGEREGEVAQNIHQDISIEKLLSLLDQNQKRYQKMRVRLISSSYKQIDEKQELQFARDITYCRDGEAVFGQVFSNNFQSNKSGFKRARVVSITSEQAQLIRMDENRPSPRVDSLGAGRSESELSFLSPYYAMWDIYGPRDKVIVNESKVYWDEQKKLYIANLILGDSNHVVSRVNLYIDPAKGYVPVKKEWLKPDGTLFSVHENNMISEIGGIWFPRQYSWYDLQEKFTAVFDVQEVSLNESIDGKIFDLNTGKLKKWFELQRNTNDLRGTKQNVEHSLRPGGEREGFFYRADFERLEVKISGMWIGGTCSITVYGNGKIESSIVLSHQEQTSVQSSFNLPPDQLKKLNRLLENADWLKNADVEKRPPYTDLTYYDIMIVQQQQTHQMRLHDRSPEPYNSLVNMIRGIYRQEYLLSSLKSEDEKLRMNASRDIFNELIARMGLKSHAPSPMLAEVDFARYEEVFVQWMSDPATYHQEELAAAIAWVGYLKRLDFYDYVIELKEVYARSDWDVVCETLHRLGGPKAVSTLKDIARNSGSRRNHAVSALIRLGEPGFQEILLILEEGILPPENPTPWNEKSRQIHERWTLAESVVRDCMDLWSLREFTIESKKQIAAKVEKLLASRIPDQWGHMRTEYYKQYLNMADSLSKTP